MIFYEYNNFELNIFKTQKGFSFYSHIHKHLELLFCSKGKMEVTCERKHYTLNSHSWLIVLPETEHSCISSPNAEGIIAVINPSVVPQLSQYMEKHITRPVIENRNSLAEDCLYNLLHEYNTNANRTVEKGFLYVILGLLFEQCEFEEYPKNQPMDISYKALQYIADNFKSEISLAKIASHLGVNPGYLSRIFNAKIGYGISDILNSYRIDYSKYLLLNTNLPITSICYESGFSTLRHFNRCFLKSENCTPSEFRKKQFG